MKIPPITPHADAVGCPLHLGDRILLQGTGLAGHIRRLLAQDDRANKTGSAAVMVQIEGPDPADRRIVPARQVYLVPKP